MATQWQAAATNVSLTVGVRLRHPVVAGKILGVILDEVVAIGGKVCVTQDQANGESASGTALQRRGGHVTPERRQSQRDNRCLRGDGDKKSAQGRNASQLSLTGIVLLGFLVAYFCGLALMHLG